MGKSMSVEGAPGMSAAVREYLPAQEKLKNAREYYYGQLKVGDIVCHKGKAYPQEITALVPQPHGPPNLDLKDLHNGNITTNVWPRMYIAPYDDRDMEDQISRTRYASLQARFEAALRRNDKRTIATLEAALK